MHAVLVRPQRTIGEMKLTPQMQITVKAKSDKQHPLVSMRLTHGAFTTCMEMYGNGPQTNSTKTTATEFYVEGAFNMIT